MQAYSKRGDHTVYLLGVTPYILGADGVKILLLEHVNYFAKGIKLQIPTVK